MLLSAALFMIGVIGVMVRRNIIIIFMSIELILNAVNINLIAFSAQLHDVDRQVFAVFVHRGGRGRSGRRTRHHPGVLPQQGNVNIDEMNLMRWYMCTKARKHEEDQCDMRSSG
jgi:NADH-quinone oxidoreductase subunit K